MTADEHIDLSLLIDIKVILAPQSYATIKNYQKKMKYLGMHIDRRGEKKSRSSWEQCSDDGVDVMENNLS